MPIELGLMWPDWPHLANSSLTPKVPMHTPIQHQSSTNKHKNSVSLKSGVGAAMVLALCSSLTCANTTDDSYARAEQYRLLQMDASNRSWAYEQEGSIKLSAQIQTRYILNNRSNTGGDDLTTGFEARRTKLKATGRLADPNFRYTVAMAFNRGTGAMTIEDVYTRWKINDDWTFKIGQFRPSVLREQIISSKYQLSVERSLLTAAFGQRYNRGIALRYGTDRLRLTASIMDVTNDTVITDDDWEYLVRGEFMINGNRSEMGDFTSFREDSPATMIGAGVSYRDSDPTDPLNPNFSLLTWSADITAEFGGSNLFVAIMGSSLDEAGTSTVDRFGTLIHGGFFVSDSTELFARYSHGDVDNAQSLNLIELGLNHYIHAHNAKFTIDLGYSLDEMSTAWRSTAAGWLTDSAGQDGQFLLRSQMQFLF